LSYFQKAGTDFPSFILYFSCSVFRVSENNNKKIISWQLAIATARWRWQSGLRTLANRKKGPLALLRL
jgi:hypothetical protein